MSGWRGCAWWTACVTVGVVSLGSTIASCSDPSCEADELAIEDGTYRGEPESVQAPVREPTAVIEGEALTIRYVQDTDGRAYVVRLRARS